jgi:hypothetical protein
MEANARLGLPGIVTRARCLRSASGFGQVPTPERLMAHPLPMMVRLGGLHTAIERFGTIEPQLRALLNLQVATLYGVPY